MNTDPSDVTDQAIAWHLRLAEASDREWAAFGDWLEAAPEHRAAFDRVEFDDLLLSPGLHPFAAAEPEPAAMPPARRLDWRAPLAALLVAGTALGGMLALRPPPADVSGERYAVATAPGERRTVTLADGTAIALNGATRVLLDRARPRYAVLEAGDALFRVRHDRQAPFTVLAGAAELRDVGTTFGVTREGAATHVAVAEGAVLFAPTREAIMLRRGMALTARDGDDRITIGHVPADAVGGWQRGRLSFRERPIAEVARAVGRTSGARIAVAPDAAALPFTGTIGLTGDPERDVARLALLTGTRWRRDGVGWTLLTDGHEAR